MVKRESLVIIIACLTAIGTPAVGQTKLAEAFETLKGATGKDLTDRSKAVLRELDHSRGDWSEDVRYLVSQLTDPSDYIRQQASALILTVEMLSPALSLDPSFLPAIYAMLKDPVEQNRMNAAYIVGWSTPPKPHLTAEQVDKVSILLDEASASVRRVGAEALLIETPLRPSTLETVLKRFESDEAIQDTVIVTLGKAKIDSGPATELLVDLLDKRTGFALVSVISSIQQIGGRTGLASLAKLERLAASDGDQTVRNAATSAVNSIRRAGSSR